MAGGGEASYAVEREGLRFALAMGDEQLEDAVAVLFRTEAGAKLGKGEMGKDAVAVLRSL